MRHLGLLALLCLAAPTSAAVPPLEPHAEQGLTISTPTGWKLLIDATKANVLTSRDAFTSLTVQWYPFNEDPDQDKLLDLLLTATNKALPVGSAAESARRGVLDGKGKVMLADYTNLLGYHMKLAFVVWLDSAQKRVVTGVMMTNPEGFTELSADELAVQVVSSLTGGPRGPAPR